MSEKSRWLASPAELRRMGIIGINQRNARFVLPENQRRFYHRVDSKLVSKKLALAAGIPTPDLYGEIHRPSDFHKLAEVATAHGSFVVKPNRGSGGKGVLVITEMRDGKYIRASGAELDEEDLRWHVINILGGLFSLGGRRDMALLEECVRPDPTLAQLSFQGAPDLRIIVFRGYPVMAMLRVATRKSNGRANLHQGAIGLGIDLGTGQVTHAYSGHARPEVHPDTGAPLVGMTLPNWAESLKLATRAAETTGLGYVGVDLMVDEHQGPLMIETNARPGLTIQLANGAGLYPRLETIAKRVAEVKDEDGDQRIAFSREAFGRRQAPPG